MNVLMQVLTLFLLLLCGLFAVKKHILDDRAVTGLNAFVLSFAQPALIVARLQQDASPELLRELIWVLVLTCAVMGVSGSVAYRLFKRQGHDRRAVLASLSMASNCGFMGYPVITAAFGEDALIYAVMYVTSFNLMCWTLGSYYFGGRKAVQPARLLTNPSILAILLGLILFLTGWRLPDFINDGLEMVGATTTPLAMFVIGAKLLGLQKEHLADKELLLACALRLVILPAAVLLLRFTPLPEMVVNSLFLCTAMPCAALTGMQAAHYRCDSELASRGVALSTALAMATVPLMLMLL